MANAIVTRESLKALVKRRDDMEQRFDELIASLQSTPVGLDESLVDRQGFPRSDVDVHQIRTWRHELACTWNGWVGALM